MRAISVESDEDNEGQGTSLVGAGLKDDKRLDEAVEKQTSASSDGSKDGTPGAYVV